MSIRYKRTKQKQDSSRHQSHGGDGTDRWVGLPVPLLFCMTEKSPRVIASCMGHERSVLAIFRRRGQRKTFQSVHHYSGMWRKGTNSSEVAYFFSPQSENLRGLKTTESCKRYGTLLILRFLDHRFRS